VFTAPTDFDFDFESGYDDDDGRDEGKAGFTRAR